MVIGVPAPWPYSNVNVGAPCAGLTPCWGGGPPGLPNAFYCSPFAHMIGAVMSNYAAGLGYPQGGLRPAAGSGNPMRRPAPPAAPPPPATSARSASHQPISLCQGMGPPQQQQPDATAAPASHVSRPQAPPMLQVDLLDGGPSLLPPLRPELFDSPRVEQADADAAAAAAGGGGRPQALAIPADSSSGFPGFLRRSSTPATPHIWQPAAAAATTTGTGNDAGAHANATAAVRPPSAGPPAACTSACTSPVVMSESPAAAPQPLSLVSLAAKLPHVGSCNSLRYSTSPAASCSTGGGDRSPVPRRHHALGGGGGGGSPALVAKFGLAAAQHDSDRESNDTMQGRAHRCSSGS